MVVMLAAVTFAMGLAVGVVIGVAGRRDKPAADMPMLPSDRYQLAEEYEVSACKMIASAHWILDKKPKAGWGQEAAERLKRAEEFVQRAEELRRKALES